MTLHILESGKCVGLRTSQIEETQTALQTVNVFIEVLGNFIYIITYLWREEDGLLLWQ